RSRWARDQAGGDRIAHLCEHGRQGAASVLQRHHGRLIAGENSIRPHPHEFGSEASQALVIPAWPALLDVDIATFDPPEILQAPAERRHAELAFGVLLRQPRNQHADAVHLLALLCARGERPGDGCAAEQRDELAALHVWMAPAWQEIIWRAAQRSLAVMCPACWCSPGGLLALDGVREPSPHHSNGIDVPMKSQVWLGCVGSTDCAITRHCSLASSRTWLSGLSRRGHALVVLMPVHHRP